MVNIDKTKGLSVNQIRMVLALKEFKSLSSGEIARILGISTALVTQIADKLEVRKIVFRKRSKEDRRKVYFYMTEKEKVLQKILQMSDDKTNNFVKARIGNDASYLIAKEFHNLLFSNDIQSRISFDGLDIETLADIFYKGVNAGISATKIPAISYEPLEAAEMKMAVMGGSDDI